VVFAQPLAPRRAEAAKRVTQARPYVQFDGVTLAIVEADGFNTRKPLQRLGKAHGRILSAGKEHERAIGADIHAASLQ
jgi:hypothetical protein